MKYLFSFGVTDNCSGRNGDDNVLSVSAVAFTALAVFGTLTVWGLLTRSLQSDISGLACCLVAALSLFWTVYHITGLCALRRQRRKYERP